jgi:TRAP transporter TAXI family solute receptor
MGINGDVMGGMQAPIEVGKRRVDIGFVNPSAIVTMAYRGKGFYKERLPLRALASFPSWDRIAFAVSKDLKLKSLSDLRERKLAIKVSTRSSGVNNTTHYTVAKILGLYGISFANFKRWGGVVEECPRPTSKERTDGIKTGRISAVFDEGLHNWLPDALEHGFEILSLEPKILKQLELLGYRRTTIPSGKYPNLNKDVDTIDFSGWPLITHRWLPNELAYAICEAMDARQNVIPVDDDGPLDMRKLCCSSEAAPLGIPLHPGAKQYYKEKGYL